MPGMDTAICWSSPSLNASQAQVCWILIAVVVGLTNTTVGVKMWTHETSCYTIKVDIPNPMMPQTSILYGPTL